MKTILFVTALLIASVSFALGTTYGPHVIGDGYLSGWTVTHDGNNFCEDPYIWSATHEIECD